LQRDVLLSLAIEGLYRPTWSSITLDELQYEEAEKLRVRGHGGVEAEHRAARLIDRMRESFSDAEVTGWEGLEGSYGLPDASDEHVVAAAVVAGAGVIVTSNLKDFPKKTVPPQIQVLPPDEFAENTVAVNPILARAAVGSMLRRLGRKGRSFSEKDLLDLLVLRYGMTGAVDLIRQAK